MALVPAPEFLRCPLAKEIAYTRNSALLTAEAELVALPFCSINNGSVRDASYQVNCLITKPTARSQSDNVGVLATTAVDTYLQGGVFHSTPVSMPAASSTHRQLHYPRWL